MELTGQPLQVLQMLPILYTQLVLVKLSPTLRIISKPIWAGLRKLLVLQMVNGSAASQLMMTVGIMIQLLMAMVVDNVI